MCEILNIKLNISHKLFYIFILLIFMSLIIENRINKFKLVKLSLLKIEYIFILVNIF